MRTSILLVAAALLAAPFAAPVAAFGQAGPTQGRSGLGTADHPEHPTNTSPAGSENATTGPQSRPAYPSDSTTPNPGAAMVQTRPKPAPGPPPHPRAS